VLQHFVVFVLQALDSEMTEYALQFTVIQTLLCYQLYNRCRFCVAVYRKMTSRINDGSIQHDWKWAANIATAKTTGKQATNNKKIKLIEEKCYWNQPYPTRLEMSSKHSRTMNTCIPVFVVKELPFVLLLLLLLFAVVVVVTELQT
jgi:hypothetical protein